MQSKHIKENILFQIMSAERTKEIDFSEMLPYDDIFIYSMTPHNIEKKIK